MVAAFFASILGRLETVVAEEAKQRVRLGGDVAKEVQRLRDKLKAIIVALEDGEKIDGGIILQLDRFTDAAYDLVDVLDELLITMLRRSRVAKTFNLKAKADSDGTHHFHPDQVVTRGDLAFKLKDINKRLESYAMPSGTSDLNLSFEMQRRRLGSTPSVDVSLLIGRDEVKGDIVSSLLNGSTEEDSELFKTISVVGMGGVGKTAIAQLVYHDEKVKRHFDHRIWVCVSVLFDEKNVAKAIIAEVEHVAVDSLNSFPLLTLIERIHRSIKGKKIFLVLDDVWTDDILHGQQLIQTLKHGAPGTRILLTTRKDMVANMMDSRVFHLEPLSDEHCWMVVSETAFYGRGVEECRNLEDIGKRISKKCKGLPLAAKTLGGLLRFKSSMEEWEKSLNSEIWKLYIARQELFVSLLLSYYDLPLPLRECFKYCAIFPKDFVYDGETIIYQWMAQGYLGWDKDEDLELRGREYISHLAACSFFQDFRMDTDGLKSTWKIHDIMHDFARFLMMHNGIVIEVMNPGGNSMIDLFSTKARYLTAMIPEGCCLPTSIYGAEKLHSLVIISGENAITNEAVQIIFNRAKRLRIVDFGCHNALVDTIPKEIGNLIHLRHINLSGSKIKGLPRSLCELRYLQYLNLNSCRSLGNLPDEVGNLIHLRHINLSGSKIKGLPASLCELHNLRYLNLDRCEALENLPDEIGKLINLRYLGTVHCCRLACYPKSARRLTNLRQLRGIVLRADRNEPKQFGLGDLENLNHLRELSMVLKGNAVDDRELRRAKFENKTDLKEIKVE